MVFGFAAAVRDHCGVAGGLGHLDGFQGLGQRANLVELDQDRVADALLDAFLEDAGVGHEQVVADQLHLLADLVSEHLPAGPVGLVHAVFDGDDRITLSQAGQIIGETGGVECLALAGQVVLAVLVELAGSAIQRQGHVGAQLIAGLLDRFGDGAEGVFVGRQVRCETAFVAHGSAQATGLEHRLEVMEDFGAHAQRIGKGLGADRLDHEFLDVDVVVGMLAAVDDVHHRHRHGVLARRAVEVGDVRVERQVLVLSSGLGGGEGHGEDGVGAQLGLVLGAVQLDHRAVQRLLVGRVLAQQQIANRAVDVADRLQHALAHVTALVAIAQLQRLARTGGRTGRRTGAADDAVIEDNVRFHGGVATGVENFTPFDVDDLCHFY